MTNTPKVLYRGAVPAAGTAALSWSATTMPSARWTGMAYGNGVFVAVGPTTGNAPSTVAASSVDGTTWVQRTMPGTGQGWSSVAYGNGVFAAVQSNGATVGAYSSDGINWTASTMPAAQYWTITFANGIFLAIADNATASTSPDGITWTLRSIPNSSMLASAYGNNTFVAVGATTNVCSSVDGAAWTFATAAFSLGTGLAFGAGLFVATQNAASAAIITSPDGITWTSRSLPSSQSWNAVTYGNGTFVVHNRGTTNIVATSGDGITWTSRTMSASQAWWSNAYGAGKFVAAGSGTVGAVTPTSALYTTPAATKTVVTDLAITNASVAATPTLNLAMDDVPMYSAATPVGANSTVDVALRQVLTTGKTITASGNTALNIHVCGIEIS